MRWKTLARVAALLWVPFGAQGAPLTVSEAMRLAEIASPAVRAREAQLSAADGLQREAGRLLFNNPALTVEGGRRSADGSDERAKEWAVGIAQPIELGGQQSRRREAAAAGLDALRAEIEDARRQARAEAATRFYAVTTAERRVQIERRSTDMFDSVAQAVAKRRSAGEDTRLDANVAVVEAERSRNALAVATEQLLAARSELATALQLPPETLPEVEPGPVAMQGETAPYTLDRLLASTQSSPRLRALAAREEAARARLEVERANRYPDVTVGLSTGREGFRDGRERLTALSVSVPLPFFKRNEAAIGQGLTEVTQAEVERATATRDAQAQVRRLWSRLQSQRERVLRLQRSMLPASADNLQLAARSRQAGQIGLLDQLLINRQALEAERELNDALADYSATQIELELAAGWPLQGSSQ
jgi:cobalt-zinc-cadmium efflux system outer membrane protein